MAYLKYFEAVVGLNINTHIEYVFTNACKVLKYADKIKPQIPLVEDHKRVISFFFTSHVLEAMLDCKCCSF